MARQFAFVAGCARSGTTVMQRLLVSHPAICMGMERYLQLLRTQGWLTRDLFEPERYFAVREGDTFYDDVAHFKTYAAQREKYDGASILGDKIPSLYRHYEQVLAHIPEARFIFLSRNIWDVASSFKRRLQRDEDKEDKTWGRARGVSAAISEWNEAQRATGDFLQRHPDRLLVASYETVFGTWTGIEQVFAFLGLELSGEVRAKIESLKRQAERKAAARTEILDPGEKIAIFAEADLAAYRELLRQAPGPALPVVAAGAARRLAHQAKPAPAAPAASAHPGMRLGLGPRLFAAHDEPVCAYRYEKLPRSRLLARAPLPAVEPGYIACIGGSQTFGRFVEEPYPQRLAALLGRPVVNLGACDSRPIWFREKAAGGKGFDGAAAVVVQVMSARCSSELLAPALRAAFDEVAATQGEHAAFEQAFAALLAQGRADAVREIVEACRGFWSKQMRTLLRSIGAPKVLLWFGTRAPSDAPDDYGSAAALLGPHPQLVTRAMVESVRGLCAGYVECVSSRGLPSRLVNRQTGQPEPLFPGQSDPASNGYYPSAEMHADAAQAVAAEIRRLAA